MIGAIIGDIIGSPYEFKNSLKTKKFNLYHKNIKFTDDTVLTIATADAILNKKSYVETYNEWGNKYPNAGYGSSFKNWLSSTVKTPYNSWGNGSAMKISPIGWLFNDLQTVMTEAMKSASCTHNHDEGIKGAMSIAVCIYLARNKTSKKIIKEIVETYFDYDLNRKLNEIRPNYGFDVSCQGSVPEAIICFLESTDYEDCIRNAISLGGDSDTQACIAGSIAEAYYRDDKSLVDIIGIVSSKIPQDMNVIIKQFYERINDTNENT